MATGAFSHTMPWACKMSPRAEESGKIQRAPCGNESLLLCLYIYYKYLLHWGHHDTAVTAEQLGGHRHTGPGVVRAGSTCSDGAHCHGTLRRSATSAISSLQRQEDWMGELDGGQWKEDLIFYSEGFVWLSSPRASWGRRRPHHQWQPISRLQAGSSLGASCRSSSRVGQFSAHNWCSIQWA